jgi:hypothetical protein
MIKSVKDYTDEEIAGIAQEGLQGQQAIVESNRRLRESIIEQATTTNRLTKWILSFTVILGVLTAVQLALFVYGLLDRE